MLFRNYSGGGCRELSGRGLLSTPPTKRMSVAARRKNGRCQRTRSSTGLFLLNGFSVGGRDSSFDEHLRWLTRTGQAHRSQDVCVSGLTGETEGLRPSTCGNVRTAMTVCAGTADRASPVQSLRGPLPICWSQWGKPSPYGYACMDKGYGAWGV
jgi:hypothetical protein